jgi:CBS domain-containing protein
MDGPQRSRVGGTNGRSEGARDVTTVVGPTEKGRLPMQARDIMSRNVVTVTTTTTVKDAATLLASHGFTALPVLDDTGSLIGLVTEADILRDRFPRDPRFRCTDAGSIHAREDPRAPANSVGAVMTWPAPCMSGAGDVVDLVTAMSVDGLRSMPIVDGSQVVGIVTRRDLVRTLTRADQDINTDVRHQLEIYGGLGRWTVDVDGGAVTIHDALDNETDRHVATVLAEAVRGVTVVHMAGEGDPQ